MNPRALANELLGMALSFSLVIAPASHLSAQQHGDAKAMQKDGVAAVNHWMDHLRTTGDAKTTLSELVGAQTELVASYNFYLREKDFAEAAWSAIYLGDILRVQNQFKDALPYYQYARDLAKQGNRPDYETRALERLSFTESVLGDTDPAEKDIQQAIAIGEKCGNKNFYFEALDVAGEVEIKRNNVEAAAQYLDMALAMSNQVDDRKLLFHGYADRGDIYYQISMTCDYQRKTGDFEACFQALDSAHTEYQKAIAVTQKLGYTFLSRQFQDLLSNIDMRRSLVKTLQGLETTNAEANPNLPEDVLVTEQFAPGAQNPQNLALMESFQAELEHWLDGLQRQGLIVRDLNPSDLFDQGQLAEMKGDNEKALAKYLLAVDLLEQDRRKLRDEQARSRFVSDKFTYYYHPAELLLDQRRYARAFRLFELSRSRAMTDMLDTRPPSLGSEEERMLFSQLQTLKTRIASLQVDLFILTAAADRDQHTQKIVSLEKQIASQQQQYQQLQDRIAKQAPKLNALTSSQPAPLENVQHAAAEGGYDILYYTVLETNLILWHINGSDVQVKKVFLPHRYLIKKAAALHDSMTAPDTPFDNKASRQLFLYLIQPVLPYIKSNRLIIIPHEELNSIPFQALQNPATGKYAGELYEISYAPSATILSSLRKRPDLSGGLLAVADPHMTDATKEVQAIGGLYHGPSKIVTQATSKSDIKGWVNDYKIIHLSVHGEFKSQDPMLSYLIFDPQPPDDGHLTAVEMFGWPLRKNSLVVLSACETGRVQATASNEVFGMVRSLLYAGASNLVLSLWEVNAASTKLWMETFYREGRTKPPAQAARLALIAVKSRPEYSHPFFWAPFVLTGK